MGIVIAGMVVGGTIGAVLAIRVQMTSMPELVAAFNGFGGGASALVAAAAIVATGADFATETATTTALSLIIGTVTLTGSFVAYGKLQGIFTGRPIAVGGYSPTVSSRDSLLPSVSSVSSRVNHLPTGVLLWLREFSVSWESSRSVVPTCLSSFRS